MFFGADGKWAVRTSIVVSEGRESEDEDEMMPEIVECVVVVENLKRDWTIAVCFDKVGKCPNKGKSWAIVVGKEEWFGTLAAANGRRALESKYRLLCRP